MRYLLRSENKVIIRLDWERLTCTKYDNSADHRYTPNQTPDIEVEPSSYERSLCVLSKRE